MRTIGRRRPRDAMPGDGPRLCDYCGTKWRSSELSRQRCGLWACRLCEGDELFAGKDVVLNNDAIDVYYEQGDPYPVVL